MTPEQVEACKLRNSERREDLEGGYKLGDAAVQSAVEDIDHLIQTVETHSAAVETLKKLNRSLQDSFEKEASKRAAFLRKVQRARELLKNYEPQSEKEAGWLQDIRSGE
jgi:hypothetical protein